MEIYSSKSNARKGKPKSPKYIGPDVRAGLIAHSNQIINKLTLECDFYFSVPVLPPTVNDMYYHVGSRRVLKPSNEQFKKFIFYRFREKAPFGWKPSMLQMTIVLRSARWLTKKGSVTRMDADNRIKPTQDAIEKVLGLPDQIFIDTRVLKAPHDSDETIIYLRSIT